MTQQQQQLRRQRRRRRSDGVCEERRLRAGSSVRVLCVERCEVPAVMSAPVTAGARHTQRVGGVWGAAPGGRIRCRQISDLVEDAGYERARPPSPRRACVQRTLHKPDFCRGLFCPGSISRFLWPALQPEGFVVLPQDDAPFTARGFRGPSREARAELLAYHKVVKALVCHGLKPTPASNKAARLCM
eukprot:357713-Chlamydomonas_euryale.AAC.6